MKHFSFLAHPISIKSVLEKSDAFEKWHENEIEWIAGRKNIRQFIEQMLLEKYSVEEVDVIRGIRSEATGEEICGNIISCMYLPEQILNLPSEMVRNRIKAAIELSKADFNPAVICLGGYTSIIAATWRDYPFNGDNPLFTIGNTLSITSAIEGVYQASDYLKIIFEKTTAVVIGATGSIGWVCAQLLARLGVRQLILVARKQDQLKRKVSRLKEEYNIDVQATTDIDAAVMAGEVIITSTSTPQTIIDLDLLKPGTMVCDVSIPHNTNETQAKKREDVLVFDGGLMRLPGEKIESERESPLPPHIFPACFAEAALLTFEHGNYFRRPYSPITIEDISQMKALADKHGFLVSRLMSFGKLVPEEKIERVRHAISCRRPNLAG